MSIHHPLLPHKHIRFVDSIVALAGKVRVYLQDGQQHTLDEIWSYLSSNKNLWFGFVSYHNLVLSVDLLFALGELENCQDDFFRWSGSKSKMTCS